MSSTPEGQVAFVTGGATGIGRAIVDALAGVGAVGMVFDTSQPDAALPTGWVFFHGDVTREADIRSGFDELAGRFGRLDVVVANAGVVPDWRESEVIDLDEWDRVFAVNVRGVIATIKHSVEPMKKAGGAIVVLGSLNSRRAHPRQCLYTATKHAVLGIVRSTALDLGRFGIRVNAIGPGPVATDALLDRVESRAARGQPPPDEVLRGFAGDAALGRIATVEDVADTAVFLAGPGAAAITGQIIPVDGGLP
jgi:NAD(P)-dependent dehydrogenase (short-subunit alcohol dehydrogenase family)